MTLRTGRGRPNAVKEAAAPERGPISAAPLSRPTIGGVLGNEMEAVTRFSVV